MGLGERLDRVISVIAPKWAAERTAARFRIEHTNHRRALASTYAAAEKNRLSFDWAHKPTSADSALVGDFDTINARARAAVRDDWAANSAVNAYRRHVIGTGIACRSAARDPQTGEPFEEFNKAADRIWATWCRAKWCDIERRKSFCEVQGMIASEFATVGQGFVLIHNDETREAVPGTMLQVFEPEMLDMILHLNPDNGNQIRHGVEIDDFGAPVAYWIYVNHHPLDNGFRHVGEKSVRIPANQVCHVMRQDRPRQTFGVSRLSPILKKLQHLRMYDEYQMVAARMEACYGGAITQDPNIATANWGAAAASGDNTTDTNGNTFVEFEPGIFKRLNPGEEVQWHDPKRPGELYEPFVKAQTNHIAAGVGLDYPTITRDFSGNTFSGQRQGMLERDYETDPIQWLIVDQLCCPVRDDVISSAIMQGILKAPGFFDKSGALMEAYLQADWRPQAKPWIDPQNQAAAAEIALNNRLTNRRNILNELGEDWRETFQQFADEQEVMDELGITPEPKTPAPVGVPAK